MSTTPQTYTIAETGTYRTTDGRRSFYLVAGTVIPMSLAIDMGLDGAGYVTPPVYSTAQIERINELIVQYAPAPGGGDPPVFHPDDTTWAAGASSVDTPANVSAGDLIVLFSVFDTTVPEVIGFELAGTPGSFSTRRYAIHTRTADGNEGASIALGASSTYTIAARVTGHDPESPVTGTPTYAEDNPAVAASITTDADNALIVMAARASHFLEKTITFDIGETAWSEFASQNTLAIATSVQESAGETEAGSASTADTVVGAFMVALAPA